MALAGDARRGAKAPAARRRALRHAILRPQPVGEKAGRGLLMSPRARTGDWSGRRGSNPRHAAWKAGTAMRYSIVLRGPSEVFPVIVSSRGAHIVGWIAPQWAEPLYLGGTIGVRREDPTRSTPRRPGPRRATGETVAAGGVPGGIEDGRALPDGTPRRRSGGRRPALRVRRQRERASAVVRLNVLPAQFVR